MADPGLRKPELKKPELLRLKLNGPISTLKAQAYKT